MSAIFDKNSFLFGGNTIFIEELYQRYLQDPHYVDATWQNFFKEYEGSHNKQSPSWGSYPKVVGTIDPEIKAPAKDSPKTSSSTGTDQAILTLKAKLLLEAYKENAHLMTRLDPLGLEPVKTKTELKLTPANFGITDLMGKIDPILGSTTIEQFIATLDEIYAGTVGIECSHLLDLQEREWLHTKFQSRPVFSKEEKISILQSLVDVEGMETYIHTKFPGAKRFSVEGGDATIAALEYSVEYLASHGASEVIIGMAHRGRLATLTRVVGKADRAILAEFAGKSAFDKNLGIAGDVKYHMGYQNKKTCKNGNVLDISLLPNPSHLEAVNPVLAGAVRARQDAIGDIERRKVVGILIHGDAAFCGQGVVGESLAMSYLEPYSTGGILHFVINNQVGFTAVGKNGHPGRYSTDIAKMSGSPIFHVNGDDPDAVIFATKIAVEYTQKFGKDPIIEVMCYRKYGHNEGDEPMYTQPVMYNVIKQKQSPATIYASILEKEGVLAEGEFLSMQQKFKAYMDDEFAAANTYVPMPHKFDGLWEGFVRSDSSHIDTFVDKDTLVSLGKSLCNVPDDFDLNPKLKKLFELRKEDLTKDQPIDWATGEQLAFATLLKDGVNIRLTGQDVGRGTFSHRHSVLRDQTNGSTYLPLNHLDSIGKYYVADSNLSEYGVLGFEFGYSTINPKNMTIWEAQFGDFGNGAQIMFDQFICSSETKWMQMSGLIMLLPHGFEGQGPEHSSARLERYLQLCAEDNIQVANPTTPGSLFHLLRRQMMRNFRKPLVVMSPKSLLRHKLAVSKLDELAAGHFMEVIDDESKHYMSATRLVLCSGKVYYDLLEAREKANFKNVAIIRLEQLYPFPEKQIIDIVAKYKVAQEIVWCQEEPRNMGAWHFVRSNLDYNKLLYVGRKDAASPATGYMSVHTEEQTMLVQEALKIK